jgi:hypothetical protein
MNAVLTRIDHSLRPNHPELEVSGGKAIKNTTNKEYQKGKYERKCLSEVKGLFQSIFYKDPIRMYLLIIDNLPCLSHETPQKPSFRMRGRLAGQLYRISRGVDRQQIDAKSTHALQNKK